MPSRHILRLASFFFAPQAKAQRAWWALNSLTRLRSTVNVWVQLLSAPATGLCLAPLPKPLCTRGSNPQSALRCGAVRFGGVHCDVQQKAGPLLVESEPRAKTRRNTHRWNERSGVEINPPATPSLLSLSIFFPFVLSLTQEIMICPRRTSSGADDARPGAFLPLLQSRTPTGLRSCRTARSDRVVTAHLRYRGLGNETCTTCRDECLTRSRHPEARPEDPHLLTRKHPHLNSFTRRYRIGSRNGRPAAS